MFPPFELGYPPRATGGASRGCIGRQRRRAPRSRAPDPPGGIQLREFSLESELDASPEQVWAHADSPAGVNRELRPLLRMSFPAGTTSVTEGWTPGRRVCRSWLFLLGIVPIEYDDLTFVEVVPGRRFLERSELLSQRTWEHERTVEPRPAGTLIRDRIRFAARAPFLEGVYAAVFRLVFALRHRNLRRMFGTPSG